MSSNMLDGISLADVAVPVADLWTKLTGKDAAAWIVALKRFLRKENPWAETHVVATPPVAPSPSPGMTLMLGLRKSADAYVASFAAKKREAGTYAKQIMAKIRYAQRPRKIEVRFILDKDLGLSQGYVIADVFRAAKAKGYKKCPPEVGPALRDQYDDQPVGEYLYVLMDPVLASDSRLEVFDVYRHSDGACLFTDDANPGHRFVLGSRWVVCLSAASV